MKVLKSAILVTTLAATTAVFGQTPVQNDRDRKPAAKPPAAAGAAAGAQTSGAAPGTVGDRGGIAGLGTFATLAIIAGAVLIVAAATNDDGGTPTVTHGQ